MSEALQEINPETVCLFSGHGDEGTSESILEYAEEKEYHTINIGSAETNRFRTGRL